VSNTFTQVHPEVALQGGGGGAGCVWGSRLLSNTLRKPRHVAQCAAQVALTASGCPPPHPSSQASSKGAPAGTRRRCRSRAAP